MFDILMRRIGGRRMRTPRLLFTRKISVYENWKNGAWSRCEGEGVA